LKGEESIWVRGCRGWKWPGQNAKLSARLPLKICSRSRFLGERRNHVPDRNQIIGMLTSFTRSKVPFCRNSTSRALHRTICQIWSIPGLENLMIWNPKSRMPSGTIRGEGVCVWSHWKNNSAVQKSQEFTDFRELAKVLSIENTKLSGFSPLR
jgi:hypothetical protein